MHFFYDAQSRPAMVKFNGAVYSYVHNLQGDIVGIVDSAGSLVVEYKYDAWGKPTLVRTLTTAYEALAELNPFRYRGYVYDEETGLYYLRSRYYNSVWKRFISADSVQDSGSSILYSNLFCYCLNNPQIFVDSEGRFALLAVFGIGAAVAAAIEAVATAVVYVAAAVVTIAVATEIIDIVDDKVRSIEQAKAKTAEEVVAKSDAKVRERTKQDHYTSYWVAKYVTLGYGVSTYIPTYTISYPRAISYVRAGGNVIARSRSDAYKLAVAVGNGRMPTRVERHYNHDTGSNLGYLWHLHGTGSSGRVGGHVFYL